MAVDHIVLLKLRKDVGAAERQAMLDGIASLHSLEGVEWVTCGENFSPGRANGMTHALVVRLTSRAALSRYATNAQHVAIRDKIIAPLLDASSGPAVVAVDYDSVPAEPSSQYGLGTVLSATALGVIVGALLCRATQ